MPSLYRFIDLARVQRLISERADCLVHPTLWPDPFESHFFYARELGPMYRYNGIVSSSPPPPGTDFSPSCSWFDNEKHGCAKFIYAQCWSTRAESDALWRRNKLDVRVEVDLDVLKALVTEAAGTNAVLFGSVKYVSEQEVAASRTAFLKRWPAPSLPPHVRPTSEWFTEIAAIMFEKREAFDFEHEFRIILYDQASYLPWRETVPAPLHDNLLLSERTNMPNTYPYKLDFNNHIRGVTLHPLLNDSEVQIQTQKLRSLGVSVPISQSSLYKRQNFDTWISQHIPRPGS